MPSRVSQRLTGIPPGMLAARKLVLVRSLASVATIDH